MKTTIVLFLLLFLTCTVARAQDNEEFDVNLIIDYSSAEQTLQLYQDQFVNNETIAQLRGNRIAASTTGMIAALGSAPYFLQAYLDSLKYREYMVNDIYHLQEAKQNVDQIKELLDNLEKMNFNRKVVATVEQIFPHDVPVSARIPLYVVALGHENVDAFVRRIVWEGDEPRFVGENEGDLTIVVNLAHAIRYSSKMEERINDLLGVVAHEVFHAAFGVYKENSPVWKAYYQKGTNSLDALLDLTQNEGIAYHLSMEQQAGDYVPMDWNSRMRDVFISYNNYAMELLSPSTSSRRKDEILRNANLSGFWESYGSMAGMYIARTIDKQLGRAALIETISLGPSDFFGKYIKLTEQDASLPKFKKDLERAMKK